MIFKRVTVWYTSQPGSFFTSAPIQLSDVLMLANMGMVSVDESKCHTWNLRLTEVLARIHLRSWEFSTLLDWSDSPKLLWSFRRSVLTCESDGDSTAATSTSDTWSTGPCSAVVGTRRSRASIISLGRRFVWTISSLVAHLLALEAASLLPHIAHFHSELFFDDVRLVESAALLQKWYFCPLVFPRRSKDLDRLLLREDLTRRFSSRCHSFHYQ